MNTITDPLLEQRLAENIGWLKLEAMKFAVMFPGCDFEDLMQQGRIGIMIAHQRFVPGRNCKFIGYAKFWIRQQMVGWCHDAGKTVRVPRNQWQQGFFTKEYSLNAPVNHGADLDWESLLGVEEHAAIENLEREERRAMLFAAIDELTPIYRDVIERYFFQEQNLPTIARECGITNEGARQRLLTALKLLRRKPQLLRRAA